KLSHLVFPTVLWLNHIARIFKFRYVPIREFYWFLTQPPVIKRLGLSLLASNFADLSVLVCPENQENVKPLLREYIHHCMESVPIGMGFQFLKAIYNGEGFKRMDETKLNYSEYARYFPENIPIFHFWGTKDPLAPPSNAKYSQYYPHARKKVYEISSHRDLKKVKITGDRSQAVDFIIEGANHMDLIYGKVATQIVQPLVRRIVHQVWGDWSYAKKDTGQRTESEKGGRVRRLKGVS
ncbi:MAG: hypothetical protein ABIJ95_06890, partial [Pseudomonadota bacterium]